MTLSRILSIFCLVFLTGGFLHAQQGQVQEIALDTIPADSIAGEINMPNVFSPNNDGINDFIEVETDGTTVYEFHIFTRTGTRVFQSKSPRIFWDGRNNGGQEMKAGVYYFVLEESENADGERQAGYIYLYR